MKALYVIVNQFGIRQAGHLYENKAEAATVVFGLNRLARRHSKCGGPSDTKFAVASIHPEMAGV